MKPLDITRFRRDQEFSKLLVGRRDIDIVIATLELSRDADPDLSFEPSLAWIQQRADELTGQLAGCSDEKAMLRCIVNCLAGEYGLHGDESCYECPESSFLDQVIQTGTGLPITLSVLYCAVAERVGVPLKLVPAPQHVVCRLVTDHEAVYVDPFFEGRVLSEAECLAWLSVRTQLDPRDLLPTLRPASPRVVIERMLLNLKNLYVKQANWLSLWPVQYRLTALNPGVVEASRDLGLVAAYCGKHGQAISILRDCLSEVSAQDREVLVKQISDSERKLALWN